MEVITVKKNRELTREGLDRLLALLDADRDRAGEQYEALRAKLVRLFEWRGAAASEEHADETLDRVARKVEEGEAVRDVHAFAGGVARLVWLEEVKRERRTREALEQMPPPEAVNVNANVRLECFDACLAKLPDKARTLVVAYYRDERRAKIETRQNLAASLEIPPGTLRLRVHRLRAQLEKCVGACLQNA